MITSQPCAGASARWSRASDIADVALRAYERVEGKRIRLSGTETELRLPLASDEVLVRLNPAKIGELVSNEAQSVDPLQNSAEVLVYSALYSAVGAADPDRWGALLANVI